MDELLAEPPRQFVTAHSNGFAVAKLLALPVFCMVIIMGMTLVSAMAIQNAAQRIHLGAASPTTLSPPLGGLGRVWDFHRILAMSNRASGY